MGNVTIETATVYRGGGRRWLTCKAACKAEAVAVIKRKHPTERNAIDSNGQNIGGGWHWTNLPRSDVLLRRMMRLVQVQRAAPEGETTCGK